MKNILLFGNPNVGKTTIFNEITNSNEKVSNFEGATLQKKVSNLTNQDGEVIDIPGTNSLGGQTIVEKAAFSSLMNEDYEQLIDVIDITNFKRNLYLLIDLLETGKNTNVILNMVDIFKGNIDIKKFEEIYNVSAIKTNKQKSKIKIDDLYKKVDNHFKIDYGVEIETAIKEISQYVSDDLTVNKRFVAIQALRRNQNVYEYINDEKQVLEIINDVEENIVENNKARSINGYLFIVRRNFIDNSFDEIYTKGEENELKWMNKYFDKIALHKVGGFVVFAVIMYLVFVITYQGGILQDIVDGWVGAFADLVTNGLNAVGASEVWMSFIVDGIIAGVGGVLVYLPQIIIMFALLTFLEAIGYFARITVLFENLFNRLGLSSHSMIPYISGLGCNVIGIMSTRTIKSEQKRIATILSAPFISCSARLPVYIIFVDLFFENNKALVLLFLYLLGVVVAIAVAFVIDRLIYKDKNEDITIYSLPKYKKVERKYIARMLTVKIKSFVSNAGRFIFIGSIAIWALSSLGPSGYTTSIESSFIGIISGHIAFIFEPLGFGTIQATASLFAAFLAKELAVSAMLVTYGSQNISELSVILEQAFNPASALSFMVFTLLYIPCLATLGVIYAELRSMKYVVASVVMSLTIGYGLALLAHAIASLFI